jgi:hypothetical protein
MISSQPPKGIFRIRMLGRTPIAEGSLLGIHPQDAPHYMTAYGPARTIPAHPHRIRGLAWDVRQHPFVQCLADVSQLGTMSFLFDLAGPAYSRLQHSIGVSNLAHELGHQLIAATVCLPLGDPRRVLGYDAFVMEIAALLHDVGHGPFSHQFDDFLDRQHPTTQDENPPPFPRHEERGAHLTLMILQDCWNLFPRWKRAFPMGVQLLNDHVVALILGKPHPTLPPCIRFSVNAGTVYTVDVDRLDYLPRDAALLLPAAEKMALKACSYDALDGFYLSDDNCNLNFDTTSAAHLLSVRQHLCENYYSHTYKHRKEFDSGMNRLIEATGVSLSCLFLKTREDAWTFRSLLSEDMLRSMCNFSLSSQVNLI